MRHLVGRGLQINHTNPLTRNIVRLLLPGISAFDLAAREMGTYTNSIFPNQVGEPRLRLPGAGYSSNTAHIAFPTHRFDNRESFTFFTIVHGSSASNADRTFLRGLFNQCWWYVDTSLDNVSYRTIATTYTSDAWVDLQTDQKWLYIGLTHDNDADLLTHYGQGIPRGTNSVNVNIHSTGSLDICGANTTSFVAGDYCALMAIWDRPLSAAEMLSLTLDPMQLLGDFGTQYFGRLRSLRYREYDYQRLRNRR